MSNVAKEYRGRVIQKVTAQRRALEEDELQSPNLNSYEKGCFQRIYDELVNLSAMKKEVSNES